MSENIKSTQNIISKKKHEVRNAETDRTSWAEQLVEVDSLINATGPSRDLKEMRDEIMTSIAIQDAILEKLYPEIAALEAALPQEPEIAAPKYDIEKHPRHKAMEKQQPEKIVSLATGDLCEAQWTDHSWYKAKIQSILGSSSAPKYLVKFIDYDETSTVDSTKIRALPNKRKREPEAALLPTSSPFVISGLPSASTDVQLPGAHLANDGEMKKTKKVPNKGILKKRASQWQDFQAKSGKKMSKKDSMFRTSTDIGSKVGFTGSGKGMTETHKRQRYDHKAEEEDEESMREKSGQTSDYSGSAAVRHARY